MKPRTMTETALLRASEQAAAKVRRTLELCAPIVAQDLEAFEQCHSLHGDTTGKSFDPEERRIHRGLMRAHAHLVHLGVLRRVTFKNRPAKIVRRK